MTYVKEFLEDYESVFDEIHQSILSSGIEDNLTPGDRLALRGQLHTLLQGAISEISNIFKVGIDEQRIEAISAIMLYHTTTLSQLSNEDISDEIQSKIIDLRCKLDSLTTSESEY